MHRITPKQLEYAVALINRTLGVPETPYSDRGRTVNSGNYHLKQILDFGTPSGVGYRLVQMCDNGSERYISPLGSRRETVNFCKGFLEGISAARESNK